MTSPIANPAASPVQNIIIKNVAIFQRRQAWANGILPEE